MHKRKFGTIFIKRMLRQFVTRLSDKLARDTGVWPIYVRDPLPSISIPLPDSDADARLDLHERLQSTYNDDGYENFIYDNEPEPRLTPTEREWAKTVLTQV